DPIRVESVLIEESRPASVIVGVGHAVGLLRAFPRCKRLAAIAKVLGIKVLIIEPGAFRTGLFGSHSASAPITDYASTVGETRHMVETAGGSQPGDPVKAAAAILTVLDAPSPQL